MPGKSLGFLVLFTGVWNSQSCGNEQSSVPLHISVHLCKVYRCSHFHRWISFDGADNMGTYTHSHRSVLTCVLMCVDLCLRTLRNIGPPVLLCFTDNAFKKMDIYGNAVSGKYTGTIFPIAFAHFMSLSDFDNSCSISNHFIIIIFIILICDQWLLMLIPYKCLDG